MKTGNNSVRGFPGPQSGRNDSGRPAVMRGMDFKGNTSSAEANPQSSGGITETFLGTSEVFSSVVDFLADFSVKADDTDVSQLTCPKYPSKISNREEVSALTRAILILLSPCILVEQLSPLNE